MATNQLRSFHRVRITELVGQEGEKS